MSIESDTRANVHDGKLDFSEHIDLNRVALEAFFRSMLKPINDNDKDIDSQKNIIVEENFSFEPLKRLYFQDFYRSLLSTQKLHDLITMNKYDHQLEGGITITSNMVKDITGATDNATLNAAIRTSMQKLDVVEMDESHFHSTIEFSEVSRRKGLYDTGKLVEVNKDDGYFFELGLMENIFKEEEEMFKADIAKENGIVSLQTITRRLTELFARLSNIRLSMLFWTDKVNDYAKAYSVAALDIFYNLLSRMSEAKRLNVKLENNVPIVDILFWIDLTGSMAPIVNSVIETVKNMAHEFAGTSVRIGATVHDPGRSFASFVSTKRPNYISKALVDEIGAWANKATDTIRVYPVLHFTNDPQEIEDFFSGKIVKKVKNGKSMLFGFPAGYTNEWGGNEYVEGLQAVVRGKYVKTSNGVDSLMDITEDLDVVWSDRPGSKRKVILISDEPNDNYVNLTRQMPIAIAPENKLSGPYINGSLVMAVDNNGKPDNRVQGRVTLKDIVPSGISWKPITKGVMGRVKVNGVWKKFEKAELVSSKSNPYGGISNLTGQGFRSGYKVPTWKVKFTLLDKTTVTLSGFQFRRVQGAHWQAFYEYIRNNQLTRVTATSGTYKGIYMLNWKIPEPTYSGWNLWFWNIANAFMVSSAVWTCSPSVFPNCTWKYINAPVVNWWNHRTGNSEPQLPYHFDNVRLSVSYVRDFIYKLPGKNDSIKTAYNPAGITDFVDAFTSTKTDLYWLCWPSSNYDEQNNQRYKMFFESAKYRIKEDVIKPINNANGCVGKFVEGHTIDVVIEDVTSIIRKALSQSSQYYARAARLNKAYADMTRPCVFVPNLVSTMMMISQSKLVKDKKITDPTGIPNWDDLLSKVIQPNNGNFTWFGRTNVPKLDNGNNIILLQKGMYGPENNISPVQNEALNWGGDYVESLTGIHVKMIDKPDESGWSNGAEWTNNDISKALTRGFEILADAFIECINDAEVMKVLDMSTTPPTPTNFPELIKNKGTKRPIESGAMVNVGDLQCSLILERIIAKVYEALNVNGSGYFKGIVPKLNVDFALRLLTDSTIEEKNELVDPHSTKYRKAYSKVADYVNRINESGISDFCKDSSYILNHVVTTMSDDGRIVNPSFKHMLEEWSLCPYRYDSLDAGQGIANVLEIAVGGENSDNHYNVQYDVEPYRCPFAETMQPSAGEQQGDPPCDRPHGCKLRYEYAFETESDKTTWINDLKNIPETCPCRALVNTLMNKHEIGQDVQRLGPPTPENGENYIHALFKSVDTQLNRLNDDYNEERNSMGYSTSGNITGKLYPAGDTEDDHRPPSYKDEEHSNVRLIYLDQLVRLCQDMFRFNMNLAFEEPYLKTRVTQAATHYYGSAEYGSFEPVTCYRFSNFHALNDQDTRALINKQGRLKYYARTLDTQYLTAINRDLSGETQRSNSDKNIWVRGKKLDNERKVPNTQLLESQNCYPYYFGYTNGSGYPYMASTEEIKSGIIDPSKKQSRNMNICRSTHAHPFYQIHLMDEQVDVVTNQNKDSSLTTFEVYVKRFRPIYLPNAEDLFMSLDRNPLDPVNGTATPTGWAIVPHKYSADVHFSKDAIIIPMNFTSRNSPRSDWFHELDYAFHRAVFQDGTNTIVINGFYDESEDETVNINACNLVGKELDDFSRYHCRDWMYPASMIAHAHVNGENSALPTISTTVQEIINTDTIPHDGANDWTQGTKGNIDITKDGNTAILSISTNNLKYFDLFKCSDVDQHTALNANWLYITTPAPGGGVETSQCLFPLPWVFFHSSRGSGGQGPANYCHGLGNRTINDGHESGFNDDSGTVRSMRFFAVNNVLAQAPVKMKLFGIDAEVDAKTNIFSKGFYDPSCCGTNETWHTHGSGYYGWPNDPNDSSAPEKQGSRPDKYYRPYYNENGTVRNGVTGDDLNGSTLATKYVRWSDKSQQLSPFVKFGNDTIANNLIGKPMTWSMWNVLRHSIWTCYNKVDPDYDSERDGCIIDRSILGATDDEVEYKTEKSMREMYREWYQRFTYNGKYTSNAEIDANTAWPYKVTSDDPSNYGQAQKLLKGMGESMDGNLCKIEWTNLVADVCIIYNEVSDTHDSCMTMYTGGHPNYQMSNNFHETGGDEFAGPTGSTASGVSSTAVPSSWAGNGVYPNSSNSKPFRYALSDVDMCRNFMALTYRGYNSSVPEMAYYGGRDRRPKFQPHNTHPKSLMVSREIKTVRYKDPATGQIITKTRSSNSCDGTEMNALDVLLKNIYPPTEEHDTEGCDMNYLQRLLIPCYPNWEDLHTGSGSNAVPIPPDAVSKDDLKKIVFCVAPMTYYNAFPGGNGSDNKKVKGPAQLGERMMAFCISQFFTGEEAEKITSTLDTEFFKEVAAPNVFCIADDLGHDYKPGDPPWGQALVESRNWDPNHWMRLS